MPVLIACPDCAAIQEMPRISSGRLQCWQCHYTLEHIGGRPRGAAFAAAITTLILLVPANLMTMMSLHQYGFFSEVHLWSGIGTIYQQGWPLVAAVVTLEVVILPLVRYGLLALVLGMVLLRRRGAWVGPAFRISESLDLWAMPDVFLIGIAIGYSRLAPYTHVVIGSGGWCLIGAAFMAMITRGSIERRRVWHAIMHRDPPQGPSFGCTACELVVSAREEGGRCPRCRQVLWQRKPYALDRALALTLAGLLLYPVAMFYPVSLLNWFAGQSPHTLPSSVGRLIDAQFWFLAACVFTTSIAIPFVKLAGIIWFTISIRRRSARHLVFKTRVYRAIEELGRWSTMDVFTVVVYMPLVQFGQLATVRMGTGLPALLAVVVLTMLASRAFDPRMLWDAVGQR